jgi:hypothetical protein
MASKARQRAQRFQSLRWVRPENRPDDWGSALSILLAQIEPRIAGQDIAGD